MRDNRDTTSILFVFVDILCCMYNRTEVEYHQTEIKLLSVEHCIQIVFGLFLAQFDDKCLTFCFVIEKKKSIFYLNFNLFL